jgi:hypothetical protein
LGLARNAAKVALTSPGAQVAIWMLLRCSTPPGTSDAFDERARSFVIVTSLFPNAARKA